MFLYSYAEESTSGPFHILFSVFRDLRRWVMHSTANDTGTRIKIFLGLLLVSFDGLGRSPLKLAVLH